MKIKLTQNLITSGLQCPEGKHRIELCDTEVPGLYVEVRATNQGTGTAYYRYKDVHGKTCHTKIAKLADLSLSEIRKKAKSLRAEVALGADPSGQKKAQKAVLTLDELWLEYEAFAKPRKRSFKRDEQIYRLQIQPTLGKARISSDHPATNPVVDGAAQKERPCCCLSRSRRKTGQKNARTGGPMGNAGEKPGIAHRVVQRGQSG